MRRVLDLLVPCPKCHAWSAALREIPGTGLEYVCQICVPDLTPKYNVLGRHVIWLLIVTSSAIDKMFEIFGPIFEQNVTINFEPIFEQNANFDPIFEKSAYFGPIFEKSVNFEHFVNGK